MSDIELPPVPAVVRRVRRPPRPRRSRVGRRPLAALALLVAGIATVIAPVPVTAQARSGSGGACATDRYLMSAPYTNATQLVRWYHSKKITGARPAVPVEQLAQMFIEEGNIEGVAGDIAFVQAMLETGWLRHSERVPPHFHNYAGIGAVDGGTTANRFNSPREGVRAQIQHLRAYADSTVTPARLKRPLLSPRFHLVVPKGKAPTVNGLAGTWASDRTYGTKIMSLHNELLQYSGLDCSLVK